MGTVIGLKSFSNRNAFYVQATADPEGILLMLFVAIFDTLNLRKTCSSVIPRRVLLFDPDMKQISLIDHRIERKILPD